MKNKIRLLIISVFILVGVTTAQNTCNVIQKQVDSKEYYLKRIKERNTLVLIKKLDSTNRTNVIVDKVLVKNVNNFLLAAEQHCVNLDRLMDLEFIAFDYILDENPLSTTLGFQQTVLFNKDYIVINSHASMPPNTLDIVVFHELVHHIRNDSFHCIEDDCSLIMRPGLSPKIIDSIVKDRSNQVKLAFKDLPKCD
tara:strand:- start:792 stop:1379 length:588 start_codon:yes stop_codon:yes gene_type:complete